MSTSDDKNGNRDGNNPQIHSDAGNTNREVLLLDNNVSFDSNKNTQLIGAISENTSPTAPHASLESVNKDSGDATEDLLNENLPEADKIELTDMVKDILSTDAGKGSGDHTATEKNDDIEGGFNIDNIDVIGDVMKPDDEAESDHDDDMELRWEDDNGITLAMGDDDEKPDGTLSEKQLLEEPSDLKSQSSSGAKSSEIDIDKEVLNNKSTVNDEFLTEESPESEAPIENKNKKDITSENADSSVMDIHTEDSLNKEDDVLEDSEIYTAKKLTSSETDNFAEEILETDHDTALEDKLLNETESSESDKEKDNSLEIDNLLNDEMLVTAEINTKSEMEISTEKEAAILKEADLLAESESKTEIQDSATKDAISEKECDDLLLEDTLLNEDDTEIGDSNTDVSMSKVLDCKDVEVLDKSTGEKISENIVNISDDNDMNIETTEIITKLDISSNKNDDRNVINVTTGKVVEELTENTLESDVSMETGNGTRESIRDDKTKMNVESSNDSLEDKAQTEIDLDQPESEKKDKDVINVENIDTNQASSETKDNDEFTLNPTEIPDKLIPKPREELDEGVKKDIVAKNLGSVENLIIEMIDDVVNDHSKIVSHTTSSTPDIEQKVIEVPISELSKEKANKEAIGNINKHTVSLETDKRNDLSIPNTEKEVSVKKCTLGKISVKDPATINLEISLNRSNDAAEISNILEDSLVDIKTDHGVHKPDVMLEIPTQELIDMDDTDLSMNLDQSDYVEGNDINKETIRDLNQDVLDIGVIVTEKTTEQQDKTVGEVETNSETGGVVHTVAEETIEECFERMFAEDEVDTAKDKESAPVSEVKESGTSPTQSVTPEEAHPSSSTRMTPDSSDEVPEVSDSLGLLAESAGRMMEDDEEPEDDEDGDEDDDFDQDESSNQISAEQSEDSNPPASEAEPAIDIEEKVILTPDSKDVPFQFTIASVEGTAPDKDKMDVDMQEYGTVKLEPESLNNEESTSNGAIIDEVTVEKDGVCKVEVITDEQEKTQEMEIETVKLSDTSDNDEEMEQTKISETTTKEESKEETEDHEKPSKSSSEASKPTGESPPNLSPSKQSPSKIRNLAIATLGANQVVNIVDLEESSSEDDIQEVKKTPETETQAKEKSPSPEPDNVISVNIPKGIDIMCTSGGSTSEIVTKEGEVVISRVPKPPPQKPARLNTSEVSIKTASNTEPLIIPEAKINEQSQTGTQFNPKLSLQIFSLDSDDEETTPKVPGKTPTTSPHKMTALELEKARETSKCINYCCTSGSKVPYIVADASVVAYYDAGRKRRSMVCQPCAEVVANRTKNLIQGIKSLAPLLDLEMGKQSQDLVEISDSESEDEDTPPEEPKEPIGEKGAKFLEENLGKLLNETWSIYDMDTRLKETQIMLDDEIEKLEQESKEIDAMLNECQIATDKLRCDLYATFECRRQELPALIIYDTPESKVTLLEADGTQKATAAESFETRQGKRRLCSTLENPAKRPAIPLGYAPLDASNFTNQENKAIPATDIKMDDDKDISVVKLSAESAPADLPPPGEISRPPLRVGMPVYAMKNAFGPWLKGKVLEIQPKNLVANMPFSMCRIKFDHKSKAIGKILPARCIAYAEPADVRMTIGTRLIALFKDAQKRETYYSGVVAEVPNPVNNYRYLVFFDDGYAQYVQHQHTRLVCESSPLVWEEVHPFSREFVKEYLMAYPERPMVRLHEGQHLKTEWNGKWWPSKIIRVDASLAQVMFVGDGRKEWIYRGSTRLAPLYLELRAAERHRPRPMPRSKAQPRFNMPYVEYTRSDELQAANKQAQAQSQQEQQQQQQQQIAQSEEIRRQRAVAKKSTSVQPQPTTPTPQQAVANNLDTVTSRVVYYTPKNAVRPYKMVPHKCGPKCKRTDVLSLKDLRTYNPLAKPLLSGWERQIVRYKGHKDVMYRAPCGRRVRSMQELHAYLRLTHSELPVDLFDFHHATHCLAEFVLNKCRVGKKDLSHGKENVPVPCVNYYDDSLPEFCSYNTERTPTAGVPLNLDPEFLCGCDCTDDCQDKTKCACWKMTLEGARTIGLDGPNVGYVYKRLPEPLPSGIYECNSRCKCKHTCLNRVAQHPLQLKLQVFKTLNRGWGIRALNDVPKGSFLCVYAGNLLTDATANLDGLNEGDEYLAELDYIEVVEQMKEGYEEDIPEADKKLDKKELAEEDDEDEEESSSSEDDESSNDKMDDDFRPGHIGLGVMEFNKRLRRREKSKKDKEKGQTDENEKEKDKAKDSKDANGDEDCITISDDEEVREPSRFMVQAGMGASEFISKYKSVRTLFGKDEACYIMDAKVQGNIGRYLNHSCCPNVFVQNVFVDTHDPRFPWVAFFALSHIKAGTELTWNYNYDVGSVPGKILYCFCGAPNCRGRLL